MLAKQYFKYDFPFQIELYTGVQTRIHYTAISIQLWHAKSRRFSWTNWVSCFLFSSILCDLGSFFLYNFIPLGLIYLDNISCQVLLNLSQNILYSQHTNVFAADGTVPVIFWHPYFFVCARADIHINTYVYIHSSTYTHTMVVLPWRRCRMMTLMARYHTLVPIGPWRVIRITNKQQNTKVVEASTWAVYDWTGLTE